MRTDAKTTLIASLIGSVAGTAAWLSGVGDRMWPAHPQTAAFLLTILCTVFAMYMWPKDPASGRIPKRQD